MRRGGAARGRRGHAGQHGGRADARDSGPTANMCNDPAMSAHGARTGTRSSSSRCRTSRRSRSASPSRFLGSAVDADGRRLYRVRVATLDGGPVRTSGGYSVLPEHDASIAGDGADLVVPAVHGGPPMTDGTLPADVTDAAAARRRRRARLVSLCTGAFVLAAAGLLDGRPATTHWLHTDALPPPVPRRPPRPGRAVRRRRRRPHLGGQRRRDRPAAAPRPPRPRHRGGQPGRPPQRRRPVAGGRAVAVRRAPGARGRRQRHGRHPRLGRWSGSPTR